MERDCVADQPQRVYCLGNCGKVGVLRLVLRTQPSSIRIVFGAVQGCASLSPPQKQELRKPINLSKIRV